MGKNKDLIKNSHNKEQLVDKKDINKSQLVDGTKSSVKSKPIDDDEDFLSVRDHSHRIVLEKTEVINPDTSDKGFKTDKTDVKSSVKGEKSKLKKTIHKNNLKNIRKKLSEQANAQSSKSLSEQANVQDKEEKPTEEHYSEPVRTETYVQQTVLNRSDKAFSADSGYADSLIQRGSDTLVKSSATSDIVNAASVLSAGINKDKKIRSKKRRKNNSVQVEQKNNTPVESSHKQRSDYQSADITERKSDCQTADNTEQTNIFEYKENTVYADIKTDHTVKTDIKSEHKHSVNELNVKDSLSANVKDNIKTDTSPKTKQSAYKKNIRKRQKADFIGQSAKQRDISYRNEADRPDIQTSIVYTDKASERIRENIGRTDNRQRDITYNSERNENFSFVEQKFNAESIINTPDVTKNCQSKERQKKTKAKNQSAVIRHYQKMVSDIKTKEKIT